MISMILATVGRKDELVLFLECLSTQGTKDFEIIIVDQNEDDYLDEVIFRFNKIYDIRHIKSSKKGLSVARNIGLKYAKGDIICFPDDDCYYGENTLLKVINYFNVNSYVDCLIIKALDFEGILLTKKIHTFTINEESLWKVGISIALFFKVNIVNKVGGFDESLGVGSGTIYGSGEETDFLYRTKKIGYITYCDDIEVFHPQKEDIKNEAMIRRAYYYGCGCGRVLSKNRASIRITCLCLLRPFLGAVIAIFQFNLFLAKKRWMTFLGRCRGIFS